MWKRLHQIFSILLLAAGAYYIGLTIQLMVSQAHQWREGVFFFLALMAPAVLVFVAGYYGVRGRYRQQYILGAVMASVLVWGVLTHLMVSAFREGLGSVDIPAQERWTWGIGSLFALVAPLYVANRFYAVCLKFAGKIPDNAIGNLR